MTKWKSITKSIEAQNRLAGRKVSLFMNNDMIDSRLESLIWDFTWGSVWDVVAPTHDRKPDAWEEASNKVLDVIHISW